MPKLFGPLDQKSPPKVCLRSPGHLLPRSSNPKAQGKLPWALGFGPCCPGRHDPSGPCRATDLSSARTGRQHGPQAQAGTGATAPMPCSSSARPRARRPVLHPYLWLMRFQYVLVYYNAAATCLQAHPYFNSVRNVESSRGHAH